MTLPDAVQPAWRLGETGHFPECQKDCPSRGDWPLAGWFCQLTGRKAGVCYPAIGAMAKELGLGGKP